MATSIREYSEGLPVDIDEEKGRPVLKAYNEDGYRAVRIDLQDALEWAAVNKLEMVRDALHKEGYHVS